MLTNVLIEELQNLGYLVAANKPYAGGFITEHYGRPARGLHAVQIEINRSLYINEQTLKKRSGFDALQSDLTELMSRVTAISAELVGDFKIAAE